MAAFGRLLGCGWLAREAAVAIFHFTGCAVVGIFGGFVGRGYLGWGGGYWGAVDWVRRGRLLRLRGQLLDNLVSPGWRDADHALWLTI